MKKILFLFLLLISSEVFAQKVEHGVLVGAGVGYVTRNKPEFTIEERFGYEYLRYTPREMETKPADNQL